MYSKRTADFSQKELSVVKRSKSRASSSRSNSAKTSKKKGKNSTESQIQFSAMTEQLQQQIQINAQLQLQIVELERIRQDYVQIQRVTHRQENISNFIQDFITKALSMKSQYQGTLKQLKHFGQVLDAMKQKDYLQLTYKMQQLQRLDQRISETNIQIAKVRQIIVQTVEKANTADAKNQNLEDKLIETIKINNQLDLKMAEFRELETKFQGQITLISELNGQNSRFQDEIAELRKNLALCKDIQSRYEQQLTNNEQLVEEIKNLKQHAQDHQKIIKEQKSKLEQFESVTQNFSVLENQIKQQNELALQSTQQIQDKDNQIYKLKQEIQELQTENQLQKQQINQQSHIQQLLQDTQAQLNETSKQLTDIRGREIKEKRDLTLIGQKLKAQQFEINMDLTQITNNLKSSQESMREKFTELQETSNKLILTLEERKISFRNLQKEASQLQQQYFEQKDINQNTTTQLEAAKKSNQEFLQQIAELEQTNSELIIKCQRQEQEIKRYTDTINLLNTELDKARDEQTQLNLTNADLKNNIHEVELTRSQLQLEGEVQNKTIVQLKEQVGQLQQQNTEFQTSQEELQKKITQQNAAISDYEAQINKKNEQLDKTAQCVMQIIQEITQIKSFTTVLRSYIKPTQDKDLIVNQINTISNVVETQLNDKIIDTEEKLQYLETQKKKLVEERNNQLENISKTLKTIEEQKSVIKDLTAELEETKIQLLKAVEINNKNALNSINNHGDTKLNEDNVDSILPGNKQVTQPSNISKGFSGPQDISNANLAEDNSVHEIPLQSVTINSPNIHSKQLVPSQTSVHNNIQPAIPHVPQVPQQAVLVKAPSPMIQISANLQSELQKLQNSFTTDKTAKQLISSQIRSKIHQIKHDLVSSIDRSYENIVTGSDSFSFVDGDKQFTTNAVGINDMQTGAANLSSSGVEIPGGNFYTYTSDYQNKIALNQKQNHNIDNQYQNAFIQGPSQFDNNNIQITSSQQLNQQFASQNNYGQQINAQYQVPVQQKTDTGIYQLEREFTRQVRQMNDNLQKLDNNTKKSVLLNQILQQPSQSQSQDIIDLQSNSNAPSVALNDDYEIYE